MTLLFLLKYARGLSTYLRTSQTPVLVLHSLLHAALFVIRLPGLLSAYLFYYLYQKAKWVLSEKLKFGDFEEVVWKPAYPESWHVLLLLLAVVPVFALLQLLRFLATGLLFPFIYARFKRRMGAGEGRSQGYVMLQRRSAEEQGDRLLFSMDGENGPFDDADEASSRHSSRPTSPTPRQPRHRAFRIRELGWWVTIFAYMILLFVSVRIVKDYEQPGDVRFRAGIESALAHPRPSGYAKQEKIFIAAMFSNNHEVLPYWSDMLVKAIHYLGTDNVFVSVVESHSGDNSPELLRELDERLARLGVAHRILTEDDAIEKPEDMGGNNRIDFLAAIRNRALEPLVQNGGYDKVIFSNDVFIEPETVVELLETADGEYDMACGLDFAHFGAYDAWVLRDRQGKLTSTVWPYFLDQGDYLAMHSDSPVPVFTCWNGIIVVRADPLLPIALRSNHTLSTDPLPNPLPGTHPAAHNPPTSPALTPPVRFRSSAPGECFSSESFLLPYDLRRQFNLQRIYVNPRVITAYQWRFYMYFKWFMRHPVLKWWIEKVYDGAWMDRAMMVVGDASHVFWWDGGDCHPWW